MKTEILKTENPENAKKALWAFLDHREHDQHESIPGVSGNEFYKAHFEHGQLWITCTDGAAWSVVDAEGGPAVNGFDFEQVSEGDSGY